MSFITDLFSSAGQGTRVPVPPANIIIRAPQPLTEEERTGGSSASISSGADATGVEKDRIRRSRMRGKGRKGTVLTGGLGTQDENVNIRTLGAV
jgi:hypothetical protein